MPAAISALFYVEHRSDVFGWHAQARRSRYSAAFFMIENFYADHATSLFRSIEDDVYGAWHRLMPPLGQDLRCPVPEPINHELDRLQSIFIDEWLFFSSDPQNGHELARYQAQRLPLHAFNVRSRRLAQLDHTLPIWVHQSPGNNPDILDLLQKCWRFYGKEEILSAEALPQPSFRRYDQIDNFFTKKGRT